MTIAKVSLHCILKVIFLRGGKFQPESYFKKNLSDVSIYQYKIIVKQPILSRLKVKNAAIIFYMLISEKLMKIASIVR